VRGIPDRAQQPHYIPRLKATVIAAIAGRGVAEMRLIPEFWLGGLDHFLCELHPELPDLRTVN